MNKIYLGKKKILYENLDATYTRGGNYAHLQKKKGNKIQQAIYLDQI